MRIMFSSTPALGHLFPLVPLIRAAAGEGHDAAVLTSGAMEAAIDRELPGTALLPAGPGVPELYAEVARRIPGGDPSHDPRPEVVAEFFAGTRVDLTVRDAIARAHEWQPDAIVHEAGDFVGPLVAAELQIPAHLFAWGPAVPDEFTAPMRALAGVRHRSMGLPLVPPATYIDPVPTLLQTPGWSSPAPHVLVRPEAYRRPGHGDRRTPAAVPMDERPVALLTMGTEFHVHDVAVLMARALADAGFRVVATTPRGSEDLGVPGTTTVGFVPLADLLNGVDVVVSVGGAGTVLAALSRALPLVLLPLGADQPLTAARVVAAGAGVIASSAEAVGSAAAEVLGDPAYRAAAGAVASEVAAMPSPAETIQTIVAMQRGRKVDRRA